MEARLHWSFAKLRTRRPAPINSTSDKPTSATTRAVRTLLPRTPPASLPRSLRAFARFGLADLRAGAAPKTRAAKRDAPAVKSKTVPSIPTLSSRGRLAGCVTTNKRIPTHAKPIPSTPPVAASTQLSVSILRDDAPLSSTIGNAHRDLAFSLLGADQKQVRDVGTRDEQHDPNGTEQREEQRTYVIDHVSVHGVHDNLHAHILMMLELLLKPNGQRVHFGLGLLERHLRLQTRNNGEEFAVSRTRVEIDRKILARRRCSWACRHRRAGRCGSRAAIPRR